MATLILYKNQNCGRECKDYGGNLKKLKQPTGQKNYNKINS